VIWIWSGVAQRIGQRIGLHHDGSKLGLPPFDTELRRRLWWQILMLEGFSQKLAGVGMTGNALMGDVRMPLNVNDSDLFPGMTSPPKEHQGASEMMFMLIRCHAAEFLRRSANTRTTFDGVWNHLTTKAVPTAAKDEAIDNFETVIQRKFLQYCDMSIPWHFMCDQLGKAIAFMMRFMAHSAGYHSVDTPQADKDMLFTRAVQVNALQNQAYTIRELQAFIWHVNLHFQWKAFLFILSELRFRTEGEEVLQAWKEVEKTYEFHPSFDKELARRALPVAVSNLALKAWEAFVAARGVPSTGEPYFIQIIRQRQQYTKMPSKPARQSNLGASRQVTAQTAYSDNDFVSRSSWSDTDMLQALDWNAADQDAGLPMTSANPVPQLSYPDDLNWTAWDELFVDFQTNNDVA
jgi:hypothetical protein